jgi:hypothetical protein
VEVNDLENPFLDDNLDNEEGFEDDVQEGSVSKENTAESTWRVTPCDDAEAKLVAVVKPEEVESREPQFTYDVDRCDQCGVSLDGRGLFVDGRLKDDLIWSNMCAQCFSSKGAGIGWGSGQLYAKQPNGDWRLVAGFQSVSKDVE